MIKIAIVEDDRTTREGLETVINLAAGFQCVGACMTAEDALLLLPAQAPEVVLMDIQLPKMSGVECVAHLKELLPSVQVIMVTVYEDPDRIFCALRAGACGYLLKRSTPEQIVAAIRDVRQGGVPMSSEIARKVIAHFQEQETAASDVENLSAREREVLDLVVRGLSNKEIVGRLGISIEGVRWHLRNIYHKLHIHSRTEVLVKFRPRAP
jgi:DNA-binding NarL/FixJ family response regulator